MEGFFQSPHKGLKGLRRVYGLNTWTQNMVKKNYFTIVQQPAAQIGLPRGSEIVPQLWHNFAG